MSLTSSVSIHLVVDGYLSCFPIFVVINNDSIKIVVHVPFQISVFIFFTYIPRNDHIDHRVVLFLVSEEPPYYFSTVTAPNLLSHL